MDWSHLQFTSDNTYFTYADKGKTKSQTVNTNQQEDTDWGDFWEWLEIYSSCLEIWLHIYEAIEKGDEKECLIVFRWRGFNLLEEGGPRLRAEREECLCSTFNIQMWHSLKNRDLESREWGRERKTRERSCASCYSTWRGERGRSREREAMDRGMSELQSFCIPSHFSA